MHVSQNCNVYLTFSHAPPTAFIFVSADCEKSLSRTIKGILWEFTTANNFEIAISKAVNDRNCVTLLLKGSSVANLFWDQCPKFVNIDNWFQFTTLEKVKLAHTNFAKVTWVIAKVQSWDSQSFWAELDVCDSYLGKGVMFACFLIV